MGMSTPPKYVVGYAYINKQGLEVEVVEYRGRKDITVEFKFDGERKVTAGSYIKKGLPLHSSYGKVKAGDKFPCHDGDTVEIVEVLKNSMCKVKWLSDGCTAIKELRIIRQGINRHPTKNVPKVGQEFETNNSGIVVVTAFINATNVEVMFADGTKRKVTVSDLNSGTVRHKGSNIYLGKEFKTKSGWVGTPISYKDPWNVEVLWQDGTKSWESASHIKKGCIKPLMQPTVEGIGYFGIGEYVPRTYRDGNKVNEKIYSMWVRMLQRCYNPFEMNKPRNAKYRNVHVDTSWYNFQNFAKWAYAQPMAFDDEVELDKDLLAKDSKIYSEKTCCIIPSEINKFLLEQDTGMYYKGVHVIAPKTPKSAIGYVARCSTGVEREYLGYFPTPEMAFEAYKTRKEEYAKELAEKWKDKVQEEVYNALVNYTVERE